METKEKKRRIDSFSLYRNNDFIYKEKERAIIRWLISSVIFCLLSISITQDNRFLIVGSMFMTICYFTINTVRFFLINNNDKPKYYELFIYLDIIMVTTTLTLIPENSAFLYPILLFLVVSTGLNYGHKIMLKCNTFVIFMFTSAVIFNSYWQNNLLNTLSIYLLMLLIPFYLNPIMKTLELNTYALNEKAHKDHLTGLYNRTSIREKLEQVIKSTEKSELKSVLYYFDLDNFKQVNDQLGHKEGDALLVTIAHNLQSSFREKDLIFRVGGDEFVLISEEIWEKEDAELIANKILDCVIKSVHQTGIPVEVTASIGAVFINPKNNIYSDVTEYITIADKAMYIAKQTGKSKYVFANINNN